MTTTEETGSILLVDDDQQVLKAVQAVLSAEGYLVDPFRNAEKALQAFRTGTYDAVLSDIKMPGMDGIALLRELRELDRKIPIILHTGYAELDTALAAIKQDVFDYLVKPADPDILTKSVAKAVLFRKYTRMEQEYRKRLEEEVQAATIKLFQMVEELQQAREEALEGSRLKSEFMANISHELRTPLNGIIGLIDLVREMDVPPKADEYLTMATESAWSLNRVLTGILDLSALDSGRVRLLEQDFDLDQLLDSLKIQYQRELDVKGVQLHFLRTNSVPALLHGDEARLAQILAVVLDNACKFTTRGSISLSVNLRQEKQGCIIPGFTVIDTGCGIPEENITTIFDSFRQADGSITRRHGGAGLGLAIAQRLVRLMGGEIQVKSTVGQGSMFHFTARLKPGAVRENQAVIYGQSAYDR